MRIADTLSIGILNAHCGTGIYFSVPRLIEGRLHVDMLTNACCERVAISSVPFGCTLVYCGTMPVFEQAVTGVERVNIRSLKTQKIYCSASI